MKKIFFNGSFRGFLIDLFEYPNKNFKVSYNKEKKFEIASSKKQTILRVFNKPMFDFLGYFTTLNNNSGDHDFELSYNRFIKNSEKNYVIILENPLALVNYSDTKMFSYFAKKKIIKQYNDPRLKNIVCISKACKEGFGYYYPYLKLDKVIQIYPLINTELDFNENCLKLENISETKINCIFVSSQFELKGGVDLLNAIDLLDKDIINLTIVTKLSNLPKNILARISNNNSITLIDFNLTREELYKEFSTNSILINPTRMDSFSLVTLEAIKCGCAVLSTNVYAIPEMVIDGFNGFTVEPKYEYWKSDYTVNKEIKKNPKETIESNYYDDKVTSFLVEKLDFFSKSPNILDSFCKNSIELSKTPDFDNKVISDKWNQIFNEVKISEENK